MEFNDDGWLEYETGDPIRVERVLGKSRGVKIVVRQCIAHYAVTPNLDRIISVMRNRGYWSPFSCDGYRDGKRSVMHMVQSLPADIQGSHALGQNHLGPGLEIANPGPLYLDAHGVLRTVPPWNKRWDPSDAIETGPVKGYPTKWTHWAKFADEEMAIAACLMLALKKKYETFNKILGHHEADPLRKFDPGPTDYDVSAIDGSPVPVVFPMKWLRSVVFPESVSNENVQ